MSETSESKKLIKKTEIKLLPEIGLENVWKFLQEHPEATMLYTITSIGVLAASFWTYAQKDRKEKENLSKRLCNLETESRHDKDIQQMKIEHAKQRLEDIQQGQEARIAKLEAAFATMCQINSSLARNHPPENLAANRGGQCSEDTKTADLKQPADINVNDQFEASNQCEGSKRNVNYGINLAQPARKLTTTSIRARALLSMCKRAPK